MVFVKWVIVVLVLLNAGYMVFDGYRAAATGSYLTPTSGEYAGQLGPWANIVRSLGVDPMSKGMKAFFILYGSLWLMALGLFIGDVKWALPTMIAFAIGSLWYLWIGTINSVIQIVLLIVLMLKARS